MARFWLARGVARNSVRTTQNKIIHIEVVAVSMPVTAQAVYKIIFRFWCGHCMPDKRGPLDLQKPITAYLSGTTAVRQRRLSDFGRFPDRLYRIEYYEYYFDRRLRIVATQFSSASMSSLSSVGSGTAARAAAA